EDVAEGWVALGLIDKDEAAWIDQPFDAAQGLDAAKSRKHHRIGKGQLVHLPEFTVVGELLDDHFAGFDLLHACVRDPLDVMVAHLAFENALGVAYAVEAEMPDIGLG